MKIVVSGASGLIGSALVPALVSDGHEVVRLGRGPSGSDVRWNPDEGSLDRHALGGAGAIIHLAGESIAGLRWTRAKKARILDSRVRGTALLARAAGALAEKPRVFVAASAVGFYGNRADVVVDEQEGPGQGFLADVCRRWEQATLPAADAGIRVVNTRLGVVLSRRGGALSTMLPVFRLGLGGTLGGGRQYMSWIALDDVVGAMRHLLRADGVAGPVNVVAPAPVTNREFTETLRRVLRRPAVLPAPAFALRLLLGEMADEMLLSSTRARPERLTASGYRFQYPALEAALRHVLHDR
jgi:uncharacterized protein